MSFAFSSESAAKRDWLAGLVAGGRLAATELAAARGALGLVPSGTAWVRIIGGTLLAAGIALLAAALVFAVAFNWDRLGHFSRFAIVQALLAVFVFAAWWRGVATVAGEAALFGACLATGALFALFGQTYQTGADPYSLFVVWGCVILPWVLHARLPSLWLLWLLIANTALTLYCQQALGDTLLASVFGVWEWSAALGIALNGALAIAFERFAWLGGAIWQRCLPRVTEIMVIGSSSVILLPWLIGDASSALMVVLALSAFGAVAWWCYLGRRDLLLVSAATLAAISLAYSLVLQLMSHGDAFGVFMFSAVYWIAAISAASVWLRGLHGERSRS